MLRSKNIAVRFAVWLTALLLPVEAMPGYSCGCTTSGAAVAQSPAKTCCGKAAKRCCCGKMTGRGCCCRKGTSDSASTFTCQCAKAGPAHDQSPPSNSSQHQTAKTLAAALAVPTLGADVAAASIPAAAHLLILPGQTSLERLSTLCRLVV